MVQMMLSRQIVAKIKIVTKTQPKAIVNDAKKPIAPPVVPPAKELKKVVQPAPPPAKIGAPVNRQGKKGNFTMTLDEPEEAITKDEKNMAKKKADPPISSEIRAAEKLYRAQLKLNAVTAMDLLLQKTISLMDESMQN